MKFPELSLPPGCKGSCSRLFSISVTAQGKVFKNNLYRFGVLLEQLLKCRRQPCAVRSLKITENSDDNRGPGKTFIGGIGKVNVRNKIEV